MLRTCTNTVAHARAAYGDRINAGHDLALGQVPVANQPCPPIVGQLVGMAGKQGGNPGLDRLR